MKVSAGMGQETKKGTVGGEKEALSKGVGKSSRGHESEGDVGEER